MIEKRNRFDVSCRAFALKSIEFSAYRRYATLVRSRTIRAPGLIAVAGTPYGSKNSIVLFDAAILLAQLKRPVIEIQDHRVQAAFEPFLKYFDAPIGRP